MRMFIFLATAAAVGGIAAPLAAQTAYPYAQAYPPQYQQQYQQQYPQPYPGQPGYGYQQGYNQGYGQSPVGQIIDQLLGNRYNVTDRSAVSRCASAAMAQAAAEYRGNGYNQGYGQNRGYGGYNNAALLRVTSITDVQRRNNGLRVSGLMSSGYGGQYGNQYGYQNRGYGDVSFRCNVDYRGTVTNVRIGRNKGYRG
jgi:hypothetical protein